MQNLFYYTPLSCFCFAYTFDQLVAAGVAAGAELVKGMPRAFNLHGVAVTHEDDTSYILTGKDGRSVMTSKALVVLIGTTTISGVPIAMAALNSISAKTYLLSCDRMAPQYSVPQAPDMHVEAVRQKLLLRSQAGVKKYGTSLEREDLNTIDWINHLQEELMDAANYAQRLIYDLRRLQEANIKRMTSV